MTKKYTIINSEATAIPYMDGSRRLCRVEAEGGDDMQVSDGFHTMDELYDHRVALFIALAKRINAEDEQDKSLRAFKEGFAFDRKGWIRKVWRSKLHADGSAFDGWFILGINKDAGMQISYHLPMSRWDECEFAETLDRAPEWDGHTSADVLERLKTL